MEFEGLQADSYTCFDQDVTWFKLDGQQPLLVREVDPLLTRAHEIDESLGERSVWADPTLVFYLKELGVISDVRKIYDAYSFVRGPKFDEFYAVFYRTVADDASQ